MGNGIDSLAIGEASQAANNVDTMVVDGIRNFLFGEPGSGDFDLATLNIQRGCDHGLTQYNQQAIDIGLAAVSDFSEITSNVSVQQCLEDLKGTVDCIDLRVSGLAEDHVEGSNLGETFQLIVTDQFRRLRDCDRFW